jgi:hypothetical protein
MHLTVDASKLPFPSALLQRVLKRGVEHTTAFSALKEQLLSCPKTASTRRTFGKTSVFDGFLWCLS